MTTLGIDEVGRGCWAGPLVVGAVILSQSVSGLTDSKLLSKLQRERLTIEIKQSALAIGLGWVSAKELDNLGLSRALELGSVRALSQISAEYDEIIIDGQINFLAGNPKARAVVKADLSVPAVSAASIIAKVARDEYMSLMSKKYPNYGFEKHVGYGTAMHLERLKTYGISELHRLSFKPISALSQGSYT